MLCSPLASGAPEDAAFPRRSPPNSPSPYTAPQSRRCPAPLAPSRPLSALPKAHLHLHFTGAMRHATLVELARTHGVRLPPALTEDWPPKLSGADERGWFRFQRLYDIARSVLRTPADERRGPAGDFAPAFRIAARAGLLLVPHGGELAGPASVAACLDDLHADRIGHGIRAAEDPALVKRLAAGGITCEVCPSSNVALGVAAVPSQVPLRRLFDADVPIALGADDPLLFGPRLAAQYEIARHAHGFTDAELADLARASVLSSVAPEPRRQQLLTGIDAWRAAPPG